MASLNFNQKQLFEKLFQGDSAGYVLNFSDRTFSEFFKDLKIYIHMIEQPLYNFNSNVYTAQISCKVLHAFMLNEKER